MVSSPSPGQGHLPKFRSSQESTRTHSSSSDSDNSKDALLQGSNNGLFPATSKLVSRTAINIRILAIVNLTSLFSWFYLEALAGGDIEWVKDHLSFLGANLILSVLCLTAALTLITLTPMSRVFSNFLFVGIAIVVVALKKWDEGESFEQHGSYNMLVFLVIVIPLNGLIQLILFMRRIMSTQQFYRIMSRTIVGGSIISTLLLMYYHSIWGVGSNGAHLMHGQLHGTTLCEWQGLNIPVVDLLPNYIQNFWTGRLSCPTVKGIEAHWGPDHMLTINCLNSEFKSSGETPTYDILPDTRSWPPEEKVNLIYNKHIVNRTQRHVYTGPTLVQEEGLEAIIANCEPEVSKVLIRVSRNENVLKRVSTIENESATKAADSESNDDKRTKPNVMVLFLDAVSRRQFYRKMAKASSTLGSLDKSSEEGPQLHEFFRYHSVGFNTDDNSRAIYTNYTQRHNPAKLPIWKDFYEAGYITSRVEDNCEDWSSQYTGVATSNYFDHELQSPFCFPPYYALEGNPFSNLEGPYSIVSRCFHGTNVHNHAFDYMNQFRHTYPDQPWFQMGSFIEGHEGTGEVLLTIDNDLSNFFRGLEEDGTLDNTIVFIMADHGLHMGINFMFSPNGRIEHMNPFLSVILPPLVTKQYPSLSKGLIHNEQALITGFEIHATLKLLASGKLFNGDEGSGDDMDGGAWRRGTLFDETLDVSRSCEQANIPEQYCSCRV
ncbi:hypothetical protein BGZ76_002227, partial [Entomortierella beljakovae]